MQDFIAVAGAIGLGGVLTAVITIIANKGKSSAETADLITQAVARTVDLLDKEISRLLNKIKDLENSNSDLRNELEEMRIELATLHRVRNTLETEKAELIAKLIR